MTFAGGLAADTGVGEIRELVAEWLPQMARLVTDATWTPALFASWLLARFSSRRVMANQRSAGTSDAFGRAMRQFVLQGIAHHEDPHVRGGVLGDGRP